MKYVWQAYRKLSGLGRMFGQQLMAVLFSIQAGLCLKGMRLHVLGFFSIMWHKDKLVRCGRQLIILANLHWAKRVNSCQAITAAPFLLKTTL